jgi:hypothetical protein
MLAYKLRYQIEVWENVTAKNAIGSVTETSQLIEVVRADVIPKTGRVLSNDDRVIHTSETTFVTRKYPKVTYSHFIKYEGNEYRILSIKEICTGTTIIIETVRNG